MYNTSEIDAIVRKAKEQRAEYLRTNLFAGMLPVAVAALLSLAIVQLSAAPSDDATEQSAISAASASHG